MSEPTIRVESCRDDGRCPECGEPTVLLKCEAVLDSYAVAWDAAPALLSEIREALPK